MDDGRIGSIARYPDIMDPGLVLFGYVVYGDGDESSDDSEVVVLVLMISVTGVSKKAGYRLASSGESALLDVVDVVDVVEMVEDGAGGKGEKSAPGKGTLPIPK